MKIIIYQDVKNLGQYHNSSQQDWIVEFCNFDDKSINPFTGNCAGGSLTEKIHFKSLEEAKKYAEKTNLNFEIKETQPEKKFFFNSYANNFIK